MKLWKAVKFCETATMNGLLNRVEMIDQFVESGELCPLDAQVCREVIIDEIKARYESGEVSGDMELNCAQLHIVMSK